MWAALGAAVLAAAAAGPCEAAYMKVPAARNVVQEGAYLSPLAIGNFNGGGPVVEAENGHGLCGGVVTDQVATMMENGPWAPTPPQAEYAQGSIITIEMVVEADNHNFGWFEFRLCVRDSAGVVTTQDCLNEHVLEFDPEYTQQSYTSNMRDGLKSPADVLGAGAVDPDHVASLCDNLPSAPFGSCCKSGGTCSPESENKNRWVLPKPNTDGPDGASLYKMRYQLPRDVSGPNMVLQAYYQTGAVNKHPEGFWNCADFTIIPTVEEESSLVGPVLGGVIAGLLFIGAGYYVRSSRKNESGGVATSRHHGAPKQTWLGGLFSASSGGSTKASGRDDLNIGQPVIVEHNTMPPSPIAGIYDHMGSPRTGGSGAGPKPKVMIAPPSSPLGGASAAREAQFSNASSFYGRGASPQYQQPQSPPSFQHSAGAYPAPPAPPRSVQEFSTGGSQYSSRSDRDSLDV